VELDPLELRPSLVYQHLIRVVVPRPIAWVSTISGGGTTNLAPFSFFSGVGSRPPSLLFCPANQRDGSPKDTLRNINETGEFVVNVVTRADAEIMNQTSEVLPSDESEIDRFRVPTSSSHAVRPPRVTSAPIQLECRLMQHIPLGEGPGGANIVIGSIVWMHFRDDVLSEDGFVDESLLQAVGRLGGAAFCETDKSFTIPRPA